MKPSCIDFPLRVLLVLGFFTAITFSFLFVVLQVLIVAFP